MQHYIKCLQFLKCLTRVFDQPFFFSIQSWIYWRLKTHNLIKHRNPPHHIKWGVIFLLSPHLSTRGGSGTSVSRHSTSDAHIPTELPLSSQRYRYPERKQAGPLFRAACTNHVERRKNAQSIPEAALTFFCRLVSNSCRTHKITKTTTNKTAESSSPAEHRK